MSILLASALVALGAEPVVDPPRGIYDAAQVVSVTPSEDGATVLCGIGTPAVAPCDTSIDVTTTTVLHTQQIAADGTPGPAVVHTYIFPAAVIASMPPDITGDPDYAASLDLAMYNLPVIALGGGLAVTSSLELPVSFEWIDPDGEDLQVPCGANQTGATSPIYPKDSYRVHFRSQYGLSNLDFDLYQDEPGVWPSDSFDAISFRAHNHDSVFYLGTAGQYLRNPFMDETHLEMGHLAPHGRPAHLYLDGVYWGVYHVREHFSAAFMASYLGGDEDDYEAVNAGSIEDGAGVGWSQVLAAGSSWEDFVEVVDEAQFLDYMIFNYYAANAWDWFETHNWMAAGPAAPGDRAGQWIFHSSDNDICLVYDYTTNITHLGGPSSLFATLLAEGHPDFFALLADRIHALLDDGGPLTVDAVRHRYAALAAESEHAIVAESAVWGGTWRRDVDWVNEQRRLLEDFFPYRTTEILHQFRDNGWYPVDPPSFDTPQGLVTEGTTVTVSAFPGVDLYYTLDGTDPRQPGGAVGASALGPLPAVEIPIEGPQIVWARTRDGEVWGPGARYHYEVDARPPIALNEWNAVAPDRWLDEDGSDEALGRIEGNGGDWIELLILEDDLDLRGWTLTMQDRLGPAGTLVLGDVPELSDLPAGLILTIAEDLPQDLSWDTDLGDWRMHLQAGPDGPGDAVSPTPFDVLHLDWTLVISDAEGRPQLGPVGESVSPSHGIGQDEVGVLMDTPGNGYRRDDGDYEGSTLSTFGAPNVWDDGAQDLSELRGIEPDDLDTSWSAPETGGAQDSGQARDTAVADDPPQPLDSGSTGAGCGCASPGAPMGWGVLAAAVALLRRRGVVVLLAGCGGPDADVVPVPEETGQTASSPPTTSPPTGVGDTPCYRDADGDGFGDPDVAVSCTDEGAVVDVGDCDDLDASVYPGAPEICDDVDDDCDGEIDEDPVDGLPFYVDADGDGWGTDTLALACALEDGLALISGDCDDTDADVHPGAIETCDSGDVDCDGVSGGLPGAGEDCPATSCLDALEVRGTAKDGTYWLELASGSRAPVWCDMTTDGGGWTLGFLRCSGDIASVDDFGAADGELTALAQHPDTASLAEGGCTGWVDLNALSWDTLVMTASHAGAGTYRSSDIPRSELRIAFGEDGYLLYGGATGYYWCAGHTDYTDAGIGAVDNPPGATTDCKGHGSLGTGWDFSDSLFANAGITQCGTDGSYFMHATWGGTWVYYGTPGGSHALWVR